MRQKLTTTTAVVLLFFLGDLLSCGAMNGTEGTSLLRGHERQLWKMDVDAEGNSTVVVIVKDEEVVAAFDEVNDELMATNNSDSPPNKVSQSLQAPELGTSLKLRELNKVKVRKPKMKPKRRKTEKMEPNRKKGKWLKLKLDKRKWLKRKPKKGKTMKPNLKKVMWNNLMSKKTRLKKPTSKKTMLKKPTSKKTPPEYSNMKKPKMKRRMMKRRMMKPKMMKRKTMKPKMKPRIKPTSVPPQGCELPNGPIKNCANYFYDEGELKCRYCASHYEIDSKGACSPCVVCSGVYGTRDFCPLYNEQWGGVTPHKNDGSYVLWPETDQGICDKFVRWGADGYDTKDPESYYCDESRDYEVAWVYNMTINQTKSTSVDGVERQVIWVKSGYDDDYRIPARPVYACLQDTIIAQTLNVMDPKEIHGAAYPDGTGTSQMGFTIHWHGMLQMNNQFMDGVAMLSQCPIGNQGNNYIPCTTQYNDPDGNDFSYTMKAYPGGTYWWHSHTGLQYGDGLFGPLIVYQRPAENPYSNDHDVELPPLMMGDWWHDLSQSLVFNLFYGANSTGYINTDTTCPKNKVKCTPRFQDLSASTFNCMCAGGTSDYPYVSGHFNGEGQSPEITTSTTPLEARKLKLHEVQVLPGMSYRLRVINAGFNYALRFSIDSHDFSVIAADGQYQRKIEKVSHFVSMPGERYDIIFKAKTDAELKEIGGEQFFIRAATYNDTHWAFNETQDGWELRTDDSYHTIYAVLNYNSDSTKDDWFASGSKLSLDLQEPAPSITKILDVSYWYNLAEWEPFGVSSDNNLITEMRDFRYPGAVPGCTSPVHDGKGPLGAPFGCFSDGMPRPIPEPDLFLHLWVNGIMYPAYNLFLAKSPVFDYSEYTASSEIFMNTLEDIGEPNMFARSEIPLVYSRGKYGTRNLDVWGAPPDSPGWDPSKNSKRGDWGSQTQYKYGNRNEPSNTFFPGHGVTNLTEIIYLPKDKWVMVITHDGGPMSVSKLYI